MDRFHYTVKPPIKDTPKEDNLSIKDKMLGPKHVHYSEVPLYNSWNLCLIKDISNLLVSY